MDDDTFNMSMRKFLKRVGVTSQQKIEEAIRDGVASGAIKGDRVKAKVVLTIDGLNVTHVVDGDIVLKGDAGA